MDPMEVFPLEEDENQIVFTQIDPNVNKCSENSGSSGVGTNFVSQCSSMLPLKQVQYSDISDDDFDIPSSQIPTNMSYIHY